MPRQSNSPIQTVVDIIIRVAFLLALVAWCFQTLAPFLNPVLWGLLIAVVLYPPYAVLASRLGGRRKLIATIITVLMLATILVPSYVFFESLVAGIRDLGTQMENNEFRVPPPTENVKDWPLIGDQTYAAWQLASENLDGALQKYEEQIASFGEAMLSSLVGTGLGILQFALSIIIAGILLATSEESIIGNDDVSVCLDTDSRLGAGGVGGNGGAIAGQRIDAKQAQEESDNNVSITVYGHFRGAKSRGEGRTAALA